MSDLHSIILATPSARRFLAALHDLSATGRARPFVWCEVEAGRRPEQADLVENGTLTRVRLSEVLNEIDDYVRLFDLRVIGENFEMIDEDAESYFVGLHAAQGTDVHKVRLVVPWDTTVVSDFTTRHGWLTLICSPEATRSPHEAPQPWWETPECREEAATAMIAALTNVWKGLPDPLETIPPGDFIYLVKTYVREVDERATRQELQRQVLSFSAQQRPLPSKSGAEIALIRHPEEAAQRMADQWWQLTEADVLGSQYPPRPVVDMPHIGAWEAIRQFFGFLVRTLVQAPGNLARAAYQNVMGKTASVVQTIVYGNDANVRVLAGGIDAQGHLAGWRDIKDSVSEVAQHTGGSLAGLQQTSQSTHARAVEQFREGAFALLDGESRGQMPVAQMDGHPAIVDHVDRVAPDHKDWYTTVRGYKLKLTDPLRTDMVRAMVQEQRSEGASAERERCERWASAVERTYMGRCMRHIAFQVTQARSVFATARHELAEIESRVNGWEDPTTNMKSPAAAAKTATLLFLVSLVLLGVAGWWFTLNTLTIVAITIALVILWLGSIIVAYAKYQRQLALLLAKRREDDAMIPYWQETIKVALARQSRLAELAQVLEVWAPIITEFIHRPFGAPKDDGDALRTPTNLGASIQLREAVPAVDRRDALVYELKRGWHMQGWAKNLWSYVESAFGDNLQTTESRARHAHQPKAIYSRTPGDPILTELSETLLSRGVGDATTDAYLHLFRGSAVDKDARDLAESVRSGTRDVPIAEFLDGCSRTPYSNFVQEIVRTSAVDRASSGDLKLSGYFKPGTNRDGGFAVYLSPSINSSDLTFIRGEQTYAAPSPIEPHRPRGIVG